MPIRRGCLLAAAIVSVALAGCDNRDEATRESCGVDASCGTEPTPTTTSISLASSTSTTTEAATTTVMPTTSRPEGIVRPSIDPSRCPPLAAREGAMSTFDLHLFARPTAGPFPIQIIGDPTGGPTAPFALVQRYPEQLDVEHRKTVDVNGLRVVIVADGSVNGNGEILWNLADGSQGYLRSRGLDRYSLIAIVASLTPRDPSATIPGFDFTPNAAVSPTLQLLVEHMNTGVRGQIILFECQVAATTFIYRITAVVGDPVYEYATVIDASVPLEVGYRDGTLVVIRGLADPAAPTLAEIIDADPAAWAQLLIAPVV